jgi:hypothetical protein
MIDKCELPGRAAVDQTTSRDRRASCGRTDVREGACRRKAVHIVAIKRRMGAVAVPTRWLVGHGSASGRRTEERLSRIAELLLHEAAHSRPNCHSTVRQIMPSADSGAGTSRRCAPTPGRSSGSSTRFRVDPPGAVLRPQSGSRVRGMPASTSCSPARGMRPLALRRPRRASRGAGPGAVNGRRAAGDSTLGRRARSWGEVGH